MPLEGFLGKINWICDVYCINSSTIVATLMIFFEEMGHFSAEIIDVGQQFA